MIRPLHPFPARMAPDLAIRRLRRMPKGSTILDPMAGSGTVLRHAAQCGHRALGFDMDPLAILMSRVWTTPVSLRAIGIQKRRLDELVAQSDGTEHLPWIDDDIETGKFVRYWFGRKQQRQLRRFAHALALLQRSARTGVQKCATDVLQLALSRIIITKDSGASLARDVSHSRPHRVIDTSTYDVQEGFAKSFAWMCERLSQEPPPGSVSIQKGDARCLGTIENDSVDLVLTSPPYLNAIDYLRGHRMSLVWLGHRISEIRGIRANTVGAERGLSAASTFDPIMTAFGAVHRLSSAEYGMVARYASDVYRLVSEMSRVVKKSGRVVLVVGNSSIRRTYIRNSDAFIAGAKMVGLRVSHVVERELPQQHRYLPVPKLKGQPLGERMRTETVITLARS